MGQHYHGAEAHLSKAVCEILNEFLASIIYTA
jgi:hypothetical protein